MSELTTKLKELTGFEIDVLGVYRRLEVIHGLKAIKDHEIWATAQVINEQIGKLTPKPAGAEDWRMRIADFVAITKKQG